MPVESSRLDWRPRAHALARQLTAAGALSDQRWREALEEIPRHVFVPRFYQDDDTVIDGSAAGSTEQWLDAVYSDDSLIVQRTVVPGVELYLPTSSSTMPSLMIRMLELLEVAARGARVLEIGTATGYNAALLCHGIGSEHVASIELDPVLAGQAAERLRRLGYEPTLAVGDGAEGIFESAPYDRIVATCAVASIPTPWIEQLAAGGRVVTDLRSEMSSTLAVLDLVEPGVVEGRLLEQPGHFMWLRPSVNDPLPESGWLSATIDVDEAERSSTTVHPRVLSEPGLRVLIGIAEPSLSKPGMIHRNGDELWSLRAAQGAWATVNVDGDGTVFQGGPHRIWSMIEAVVAEWERLGRPGRNRYGLTATSDGSHRYWVDGPQNSVRLDRVAAG